MKSNLNIMNHNDNPPTESVSNPSNHPCLDTDTTTAALEVITDDGISYVLPYAQFLFAERISNPALLTEPDAPPEKMVIHFAQAQVVLLGSGLKTVSRELKINRLALVQSADRRLASSLKTHLAAVTLTLTKENV